MSTTFDMNGSPATAYIIMDVGNFRGRAVDGGGGGLMSVVHSQLSVDPQPMSLPQLIIVCCPVIAIGRRFLVIARDSHAALLFRPRLVLSPRTLVRHSITRGLNLRQAACYRSHRTWEQYRAS